MLNNLIIFSNYFWDNKKWKTSWQNYLWLVNKTKRRSLLWNKPHFLHTLHPTKHIRLIHEFLKSLNRSVLQNTSNINTPLDNIVLISEGSRIRQSYGPYSRNSKQVNSSATQDQSRCSKQTLICKRYSSFLVQEDLMSILMLCTQYRHLW